jgi:energy-converting hydrogenase A subunit M
LKIKLDNNESFLIENAILIWNFIENYFEKDENANKNEINNFLKIFIECKKLDNKFKYNCIRYSILLSKTQILLDFINSLEPGVYLIYCLQLYKNQSYFNSSFLLNIYEVKYKNTDENENYLADFADYMLTIDNIECYNLGKSILESLGKYNDLYNSKQNIHMLNININEFIDFLKMKLLNSTLLSIKSTFEELRLKCITNNQLNALERIEMDNSRLQHVELSQLLNIVYNFIINSEHKKELIHILLSELEDMSGTCTTGHYYRLINVLSGYYNFVSINPVLELRSVIKNRLTRCIESDEILKERVVDAMMEKDENKLMILLYVYLEKIKNEMFKEYNNIITFEKIEEELRNVFISYTLDI